MRTLAEPSWKWTCDDEHENGTMLKYTYRRSISTKQSYRPKVIQLIDNFLSLYSMAFRRWFVVVERWRQLVMVLCLSFCTDMEPHTASSNGPKLHSSSNILVWKFPSVYAVFWWILVKLCIIYCGMQICLYFARTVHRWNIPTDGQFQQNKATGLK